MLRQAGGTAILAGLAVASYQSYVRESDRSGAIATVACAGGGGGGGLCSYTATASAANAQLKDTALRLRLRRAAARGLMSTRPDRR